MDELIRKLKPEKKTLHQPVLEELVCQIETGMAKNFKSVTVSIVDCPDLTKEPFGLADSGLGGSRKILDVGGVPYLIPSPVTSKIYNFDDLAKAIGIENPFFLGAGAGGCHIVGVNSEMMANLKVSTGDYGVDILGSKVATVGKEDQQCHLVDYTEKEFCLLGNLFASEGKPGKVLRINAKQRIGCENFVTCLRKVVSSKYNDACIGLGGVFIMKSGKAKLHVMPEFSKVPLESDSDVEKWLKFYEMSSPLICLSVLVSTDPGLDLRIEHTHCFSYHGEGGHYHCDTTPDDVEYEAFYAVAEEIYRIDRPQKTHLIGRD